jgi:hypothetical protein
VEVKLGIKGDGYRQLARREGGQRRQLRGHPVLATGDVVRGRRGDRRLRTEDR